MCAQIGHIERLKKHDSFTFTLSGHLFIGIPFFFYFCAFAVASFTAEHDTSTIWCVFIRLHDNNGYVNRILRQRGKNEAMCALQQPLRNLRFMGKWRVRRKKRKSDSNIQINCSKNMTLTSCLWYSAECSAFPCNTRQLHKCNFFSIASIVNCMHFVWMRPLHCMVLQCKWRLDIFIFSYFSELVCCSIPSAVNGPGFYL